MLIDTFNNIESIYKDKETIKNKIKKEYRIWVKTWKTNYAQLTICLNILTDKMIEWEKKDKKMSEIYKELIKKLRKHMKKQETMGV